MSVEELEGLDITRVRAENPGPYTLSGTNTWVVGRDPAWVVDPGPDIAEHIENVAAAVEARVEDRLRQSDGSWCADYVRLRFWMKRPE